MDRIDKFVNNRTPKKTVLVFIITIVISAVVSLFISEKIANYAAFEQLEMYLSTVDREQASSYGYRQDMPMRLVPCWHRIHNVAFMAIFSVMCLLSFFWTAFSIHELFGIYNELDRLSNECMKSADKLDNLIGTHGRDIDCVRRVSDSAKVLANRIIYLNKCIDHDKNYLRNFLSDFSHQIKTALAVIRLNADMLAETENLPAEYREQLSDEIQLNLDAMETLVVQAIKLARLESQTVEYNMQKIRLDDTCKTAIKRMMPLMRDRKIALDTDFSQDIELIHDKGWLCEAIENVLKNSADHSHCTRILIELEENPAMVKLSITDNGKGIPQKEIPNLFEPFAKKSADITMKSAGLGMSIAQKIVRNHGGEIIVYSKVGEGTRFEFAFVKI